MSYFGSTLNTFTRVLLDWAANVVFLFTFLRKNCVHLFFRVAIEIKLVSSGQLVKPVVFFLHVFFLIEHQRRLCVNLFERKKLCPPYSRFAIQIKLVSSSPS